MKKTITVTAIAIAILLNGCSYEERVALGAVAGASIGALAVDSSYRSYPQPCYPQPQRPYYRHWNGHTY